MEVETNGVAKEWITEEEKEIVKKFRERVDSIMPAEELSRSKDDQDAFLLRWLRARDLDLDKAENLLKTTIQWRKDNNVDEALTRYIDPYMFETYQWEIVGSDLEGRPVSICNFGTWDFRKMVSDNKTDHFDNFVQHFFETVMKNIRICNEKKKPGLAPVTQFLFIFDVNGYPYGQLLSFGAMKKWFQMAATYEQYFPEVVFRVVFFNCPSFFPMFINMLKAFLCPRTLAKFRCYPTLAEWQKEMPTYLDPAILPESFGGTCKTNPLDRTSNSG